MRIILIAFFALTLGFAAMVPAFAQEDDKGFLTRTLQDSLSGAGRVVSIDGFRGALSSAASFDRMTIADDDGVWLTLTDVQLVWNRAALLRGRLEVESLTARQLDVPRAPIAQEGAMPAAEAGSFRLPELPVSIRIAELSIAQITLGTAILGEAAELSLSASAELSSDLADIDIQATRTDAKQGRFLIKADFDRSDSMLDLLIHLNEGPQGIAAKSLGIPGEPSVELSVGGSGPLDEFSADVNLSTDAVQRLVGQITLGAQTPRRVSDTPDRRIQADVGGDITALLAPRYRSFFGTDMRLTLDALLQANGALDVSAFALKAQAANLEGKVTLNQDHWPTMIDIRGRVADPKGAMILLPFGGDASEVEEVTLRIDYDAAKGDAIDAAFDLSNLRFTEGTVGQSRIALLGTLASDVGRLGRFSGDVTFAAQEVALADTAAAQALGQSLSGRANLTYVEGEPLEIRGLTLSGSDYNLRGAVVIDSLKTGLRSQLDATLEAQDLSRFSGLAGREIAGQTAVALEGTIVPLSGAFDLNVTGTADDLALGIAQADAVMVGRTALSLTAIRDETGAFLRDLSLQNAALDLTGQAELRSDNSRAKAAFRLKEIGLVLPQYQGPVHVTATATQDNSGWTIDAVTQGPYGAALTAQGLVTGPNASVRFSADVPDANPFADQLAGPIKATGLLRQTPQGWQIETRGTGPYRTEAMVQGLVSPALDVTFDLSMADLAPLAPPFKGPMKAEGRLRQTNKGLMISTDAKGPFGAKAFVEGLATGPEMQLAFQMSLPDVRPLAPGLSGSAAARGTLRQTPQGIALKANASGPYSAQASAQGVISGPQANVDFNLSLPNLAAFVDKVNGPLRMDGTARKAGSGWRLETNATGPAGTKARLAGLVRSDGRLNLDLAGTAPLGLGNPFLAPRDLQGQARFDLAINGPAALSSLTGRIQTSGATFSAPNLRLTLQGIAADVRLANSRAQLEVSGQAVNGGSIRASGGVALTSGLGADIGLVLDNLVVIDPRLYRSSVSGTLRLQGPLSGGAVISGQVNVGETTVNVPSTGLTSIGDIPAITHIGATRPVMSTRRKAGVVDTAAESTASVSNRAGFGLDLRVNAPNRIFVRGRGLDAELGGALTLTGTTTRIISAGGFDLLRGRLDILGKRFDLVEGTTQFQGELVPFIRFVSSTKTQTGEVRVIVQGPADAPEVRFESTPEAPEDEVLAQLLFGRNISEISPFQALQLANAVAVLAGRGGIGVISNLRNGFGLDDLDVSTSDSGATAVRAGKYISDNIYTDVTAASDGSAEISLNLDITSHLKGKATLGNDGNSGIGIFFEKDY